MAIFDFLLGTPATSSTQYDPQIVAARNLLLERIMAGLDGQPINVPTYFAPTPQTRYSGVNNLLASLGLDTVNPSLSLPTEDVAGVQAYSTAPLRDQIMEEFKANNPELYEQIMTENMNTPEANAPLTPMQPRQDYKSDGPSHIDIMKAHNDAVAAREARRVTLSDGTTGYTPSRPLLRPDSRVGISGFEQNLREGISTAWNNSLPGKIVAAIRNEA